MLTPTTSPTKCFPYRRSNNKKRRKPNKKCPRAQLIKQFPCRRSNEKLRKPNKKLRKLNKAKPKIMSTINRASSTKNISPVATAQTKNSALKPKRKPRKPNSRLTKSCVSPTRNKNNLPREINKTFPLSPCHHRTNKKLRKAKRPSATGDPKSKTPTKATKAWRETKK
jgi:hypothetical protein